jgi:hypothetical protein
MKNKTKLFVGMTIIALMFAFLPLVYADECVGQSCGADINLTIGNTAPTIPYVEPISAVTLNGGTTKAVTVVFNATDSNGYADLNDSTAKAELIKGVVTRSSASCSVVIGSGDTTQYSCSVNLQFYDEAGVDWEIHASVDDLASETAENNTEVFTVNALDYVSQDVSVFGWLSATLGANDVEASNPIVLTNGGNQDYTAINIKGQKAVGSIYLDEIGADKFSVDNETGQTSGQIYMVDNTNVDVSSMLGLTTHGASVTESIFAYVDVPTGIRADTYLSSTAWAIALS